MAEPLITQYGPDIPVRIATAIQSAYRKFDKQAFVSDCLQGYEQLNLMQRGTHMAHVMRRHLPQDYPHAIEILLASLKPRPLKTPGAGLAPFFYLPHTCYVAAFGLDHFEQSMRAQYELTKRFTAEFSIRPFLERYPEKSLERLQQWTDDVDEHVRRLVSEGPRPRLPWASRLREFQKNPQPVLRLLELLKDDKSLYVRRSVANNLNDIGKDHPVLLIDTAKQWLVDATPERTQLVGHALRSAIKRGEAGVFDVLGYGRKSKVEVRLDLITPENAPIGGAVELAFTIVNKANAQQQLLVDLQVGYMKASGTRSPKIFKLKKLDFKPGESIQLKKKIGLQQLTTRTHYAGEHTVDVLINGELHKLGSFFIH